MKNWIKRELRDLQTLVPVIRNAKFAAYNSGARIAGLFVEPEFKLLAHMAPCGLALDIGGNWGQSVEALKKYARPDKIVTFEPNPTLAARLSRNYGKRESVGVQQVALSEAKGKFSLHIPRYRQFEYDGLASLDCDEAEKWLNESQMARFDPGKLAIETCEVAVERLDSYDYSPDIIKIDVQGLEESVARGGIETIKRSRPVMIVEAPNGRFVELVKQAGLTAFRWDGSKLPKNDTSGSNTIFLSPERREALGL